MSLADRINNKFEEWRKDLTTGLAGFLVAIGSKGLEVLLDILGKAIKPSLTPTIDRLLVEPDTPEDVRKILTDIKTSDGQWQGIVLGALGGTVIGGTASASIAPPLERLKQTVSKKSPFQVFDYPIVLAGWLRNKEKYEQFFEDLRKRGYPEDHIDALKELVWLRLDPTTIQHIWLRDKAKYEHLWKDLHDVGWDDERIEVYKKLAEIIPSPADLIRMAVREVFTPEIVQKFGQMEDFPTDFAKWGEKVGLTEEWARNYWAAHWDLPSATQGFEMLHRGVITYDELKILLRALDVMPYWRDKLIEIAYTPYTRVDVRRMYKVGVLDEAGVFKAYKDLGYDDERARNLTEFTLKYYGREEGKVEEEEEKIRELTRADICDGYRRGIFNRDEASELLFKLGYEPESTDFYLDREDLKKDQALKDAYATNYRQLFVIGVKDVDTIKKEMVELGFLPSEVDEYIRLWWVEKLRRQAKPSRSDLARFLKKGIISEETWRQSMVDLGYSDEHIEWYLADIKT